MNIYEYCDYRLSALQLGIAAIPLGLYGDWAVFLATAASTLLAYVSVALLQWREEKRHTRTAKKDMALTLGNGSQHVIVIQGAKDRLDLEALATGRAPDLWPTRYYTLALAILRLALLITCTGIESNTWYLLATGGLGMLHNIVVAAAPRRPEAMGLPIELSSESSDSGASGIFAWPKVMWTLMDLETKHPGYGKALLSEFFPMSLREWEQEWWALESGRDQWRVELMEQHKFSSEQKKHVATE